MPNKNYDVREILYRLSKKGIKLKHGKNHAKYLEIPKRLSVGIKLWGYFDFLGYQLRRSNR